MKIKFFCHRGHRGHREYQTRIFIRPRKRFLAEGGGQMTEDGRLITEASKKCEPQAETAEILDRITGFV